MGDFRKGGEKRFGGRGGGFNRRDGNRGGFSQDRDRGPVVMHQATCAQCGKSCEVPFRPTSGKPVYCNTCFESIKRTGNNRGGDRFPQKSYDNYKNPVKFDSGNNASQGDNFELKKQLETLNSKMDRLISAVESMTNIDSLKTTPIVKAKKSVKKTSKK